MYPPTTHYYSILIHTDIILSVFYSVKHLYSNVFRIVSLYQIFLILQCLYVENEGIQKVIIL